jgi:hypothetical protein
MVVGVEPKYFSSRVMPDFKKYHTIKILKNPRSLKSVIMWELWSNEVFIGTVSVGTASVVINKYVKY